MSARRNMMSRKPDPFYEWFYELANAMSPYDYSDDYPEDRVYLLREQFKALGFKRVSVRKDGRVNATRDGMRFYGLEITGMDAPDLFVPVEGESVTVTFTVQMKQEDGEK